jgi:tellurite resistance protein TehA-like permease
MLLILGVWRYVYKRFPLQYDPLYWAAVFPLGMYSLSTWQMNVAMNLEFLALIPQVFFYVAALAWTLTFIGLLLRTLRRLRPRL